MRIFYRIFGALMFVMLLVATSNVLIGHNLMETNLAINRFSNSSLPISIAATEAEDGVYNLWLGAFIYSTGEEALGQQYKKDGEETIDESLDELEKLGIQTEELRYKYEKVLESHKKVTQTVDYYPNDYEKTTASLNLLQQRANALEFELSMLAEESKDNMLLTLNTVDLAAKNNEQALNLNIITFVVLFLSTTLIAIILSKSISLSLNSLASTVDSISKGNFKTRLGKTSTITEIKNLSGALERIMKTMKLAVLEKHEATKNFSKAFYDTKETTNTGENKDGKSIKKHIKRKPASKAGTGSK